MTYAQFIAEFDSVIQVFGEAHFAQPMLDRAHFKVQDLDQKQLRELCEMIIDSCEYAPKVPKVLELANIVRARHREGVREVLPTEEGPRTPEVGRRALATITNILMKSQSDRIR